MNGDIIEEDDADEEEDQGAQTSKDGAVEQVELATQSDVGRAVLLRHLRLLFASESALASHDGNPAFIFLVLRH